MRLPPIFLPRLRFWRGVILAIGLSLTPLFAAELPANPPLSLAERIVFGEHQTYTANWNGFPVGFIHTRVWQKPRQLDGQPTAMLEMNIESNDFLSLFYPVTTTMKSFIALSDGASLLFRRQTREGNYRANDRVIYDYTYRNPLGGLAPRAIIEQFVGEIVGKIEHRPIPARVCDPLAIVWRLRWEKLNSLGARAQLTVSDRYFIGEIIFTVVGEEEITIPAQGKFPCWTLTLQTVGKERGDIGIDKIFIDKNTALIRRAELAIPIGKISLNLIKHTVNPNVTAP